VKRRGEAALLLAPGLLVLVGVFAVSQLMMLVASFGRRSVHGGVVYDWTLANYVRAFDPLYVAVIGRSALFAFATTALCLLIGYPVAFWLARRAPLAARSGLLVLVILPFWTSFLVRMYAWIVLLRTEGMLGTALGALGLPAPDILYTHAAVLVGQVYGELPFMILPLYASLEKLDREVLDAASDLGASPAQVLRRVVLPLTRPGIVAGSILVFVPSLGAFLAPDLLGGARTAYLGNLVQSQFAMARDIPFGAALSTVLALLVAALLGLFRRPLEQVQPGS
jgi:spermidine/putrescine transport system permease protein